MSTAAIAVEGLGKRYRLGEREPYVALRDVLSRAVTAPFRFKRARHANGDGHLWALRNVSFAVRQGETLGIIGRNGAGKSTLLKILAGITRPTEGYSELRGRVGSLLEVGTGFHPELTGRENVYFSGSILGMKRREIDRKFDQIAAFSGTETFLDTPLKHYSSGMQLRLAFSVAAHLEPEVLLVDEVLAVGDIEFQKKCLGKMEEVTRGGRTVLFVSHNMGAINALCSRCIILDGGAIEFDGRTTEATARYYAESLAVSGSSDLSTRPRTGNGKARFSSLSLEPVDASGRPLEAACPGCDLRITVTLQCQTGFAPANLALIFYDSTGHRIIDANTAQQGEFVSLQSGQTARATFLLREVLLRPGKYLVGLWLGRAGMETIDDVEYASSLDFIESEETTRHTEIFPGTYLCRFEQSFSVLPQVPEGTPRS
jgi:lipopolysaccharide transport system ATP-binding protein